jgi:hypothetical protein
VDLEISQPTSNLHGFSKFKISDLCVFLKFENPKEQDLETDPNFRVLSSNFCGTEAMICPNIKVLAGD